MPLKGVVISMYAWIAVQSMQLITTVVVALLLQLQAVFAVTVTV
jgi:hypothetical protein